MNRRPAPPPVVLLFAKTPRTGLAKTRLAADLGEDRAIDLYRAMVERQLREIPPSWPVEIHFTPVEAEEEMRTWLGSARHFRPQADGDLGRRLRKAFGAAFARGATSVIALGGDCPELDRATFHEASTRLGRADLVLGPASNGGYYLLALRRAAPELFDNIPWDSDQVLATTLARAKLFGLSRELLTPKADIDDAKAYRAYLSRVVRNSSSDSLTIIIPTLNESAHLRATLDAAAQSLPSARLIVADGQSTDRTREIAAQHGAHVIVTRRGRARQCRAAAAIADSDWLLFLHADTRLPPEAGTLFSRFTIETDAQIATFRLRFDSPSLLLRACGWFTRFDSVFTRFGNQGILIRREFYDALGGFPDWPLFEDVALLQRARAATRVRSLPACVTTSARRFNQRGVLAQQWRNARLLVRYLLGTPPAELAAHDAAKSPEPKSRPASTRLARTPESVR
mgnify:CR=1 FL=1|jgi:Uncharacterized protein conserved in bacteria